MDLLKLLKYLTKQFHLSVLLGCERIFNVDISNTLEMLLVVVNNRTVPRIAPDRYTKAIMDFILQTPLKVQTSL